MSAADTSKPVAQLREILSLLSTAVEKIASEWELHSSHDSHHGSREATDSSVSHTEYDAVNTVLAAVGSLESLVLEPHVHLISMSMSYTIARALHIAAEHNVADLLARAGEEGLHAADLARSTGIEEKKLCRIMRSLTSHHVFQEVEEDCFANNHVSGVLVGDAPFRAHVLTKGQIHYTASDFLPGVLSNLALGQSYDPTKTAFQQAVGTKLSLFDWMHQQVPASDPGWRPLPARNHPVDAGAPEPSGVPSRTSALSEEMVPRPETALFNLSMAGIGRGTEQYYMHDFPWKTVGSGTVVDVGGGIGKSLISNFLLHSVYPELSLVIQDRKFMIQQARSVWGMKYPSAILEGKVSLVTHDFFETNPVRGAEVYWLRYIMHDWSDNEAIAILSRIAESMSPQSRVLIADIVANTTLGCDEIRSAPKPLLANYGRAMGFAHMMDLSMMMMVNGRERTPAEFRRIIGAAGLAIVKIWGCRGPLSIIECRLV
ncbi:related to O-methyltransferase [Phialocephala subalpina]|uniref:Related to O-methyltransferase n=1 Tax=Phialocephala subalpina TaxID=576137 RepID=A0A1L7WVQ9_9HELO|nr:related to O-methyltransferase [Phialocephala subalpina]